MITAVAKLKSVSAMCQGRFHDTPKLEKESPADYEERVWREKAHVVESGKEKGFVCIPALAFKNCIAEAAKYISLGVPGKGKATWTKHFEAGVLVVEPMVLPIKKEELNMKTMFVPSDGKRGGGSRVKRNFPIVHEWEGEVEFLIFDETITESVFKKHLEEAGKFIGIGSFRVRNNGILGRFTVEKVTWKKAA